jgi:hypothetical protein
MITKEKIEEKLINEFNKLIKEYCEEYYGHLIDTDDNAGQRYRELISSSIDSLLQEIVICSAIKVGDLIIRGHRHSDCYHNLSLRPFYKDNRVKYEEGFITSLNRFVGREEAQKLQIKVGIKSVDKDGYRGDILYSEDLY